MFQIYLSVDERRKGWLDTVADIINLRVRKYNALLAKDCGCGRHTVAVACENEHKVKVCETIKDVLSNVYASQAKREFFQNKLKLPIDNKLLDLLVSSFVVFDRKAEREMIKRSFDITNGMAIDGIYDFKLTPVKKQWNELIDLTVSNSAYLSESSVIELIRFLLSSADPKVNSVRLRESNGYYTVCGISDGAKFSYKLTADSVIKYLIDIAPVKITICGEIRDFYLQKLLTGIFDCKNVDNKEVEIFS